MIGVTVQRFFIAYRTGLSQNGLINTQTFNTIFKDLFNDGQIFYNYVPTVEEKPLHSFAESKELFKSAKKGSKKFRKELSNKKSRKRGYKTPVLVKGTVVTK